MELLPVALAVVAVLTAAAAFAVARRQSVDDDWRGRVERGAARVDAPTEVPITIGAAASGPVLPPIESIEERPSPAVHPAEPEYAEASAEEQGVTRRRFLNRSLLSLSGVFAAGVGLSSLAFLWPRVKGGFGSVIDVGDVDEILRRVLQPDGTVVPLVIPEGQAYVVPILDESLRGSQFEDNQTVVEAGVAGLVGLWHRCVHLGCRVPWCGPSQGFECPCHGSVYNSVGEYIRGPAPRNLDRFVIEVNGQNRLVMRTREIIQTSRAPRKSVVYPQGPSCISI